MDAQRIHQTSFLSHVGKVTVNSMSIDLRLDQASKLYGNRPFAFVRILWADERAVRHEFRQPWVKDGNAWFTRCTGFLAPDAAARPDVQFTPREADVLRHFVRGSTAGEIANSLSIRRTTVESYLSRLRKKAGVPNRRELVEWAQEN